MGNTERLIGNIRLRNNSNPPCLQINSPVVYENKRIIEELFISFFGVSNLPVTLWGKIYKTDLITEVMINNTYTHFIGDDLSINVEAIPNANSIVIIPNIIYYYRYGGYTSKFNPQLLDNFIDLYKYKLKYTYKYHIPQDAQFYMDVELMNISRSYLTMCVFDGKYTEEQLISEIKRICNNTEIHESSYRLAEKGKSISHFAKMITVSDSQGILEEINYIVKKERINRILKSIIKVIIK